MPATPPVPGKPHIRAKSIAKVVIPPAYHPDLEAHGLRLNEASDVVPIVECPDRPPHEIMRDPRCQIDARLWEGQFERNGRLRESRVTDRLTKDELTGRYTRLRESLKLTESDWFTLGGYGSYGAHESPLTRDYAPLIPGPATRQQYWADYWQSSAKCFEASTHAGIGKKAVNAMVQFPVGRGVRWDVEDDQAREVWERFWKGNNMRRRFRSIMRDLSIFGEQMLRYFPAPRGDDRLLIIRQIDPATVYEIVTDQEDVETVFFYHQQFQTRMELYSPPVSNRAPTGRTESGVTRYIIRQIDAGEIDHWKVHTVSGEARGRSDLFPVLGDLKRIRDLLTSKVVQSDIGNRVMAILKANGTGADLQRVLNTIFPNGQPPAPGTIVALNDATELTPFQYSSGREVRADFTYDELVDSICAGLEIARPYLGLAPAQGGGTTQAAALTNVEPSVKAFEERQDVGDEMLHEMFDRVMRAAGITKTVEREFIFPTIVKEDRSKLLEDLEMAEGNDWLSKRSAATQAAAQFDRTDYDFDEEQDQIVEEFKDAADTDGTDEVTGLDKPARGDKIRRPMIRATSRQVPKLDPTKAQVGDDEPPGLLVGGPQPAGGGNAQPAGAGGMPGSRNPAGASNGIRESAATEVRRHPDDPEYQQHATEFERQSAENLRRLLDEIAA